MNLFAEYARYYDICYASKDYAGECDFIERAFLRFGARPRTILDLACGTGNHGLRLAARGYRVCGVDRSPHMLDQLRAKARAQGISVKIYEQDVRALDLDCRFDAAICMFDAVSYLTENSDLEAFFHRVREHLNPHGLFLFDFWHAGAVLRGYDPVRLREYPINGGRVIRVSRTTVDVLRQVANVEFRLMAFEGNRLVADFSEVHPMRFFLAQEMCFILQATGWRVVHLCPAFDLDAPISADMWHLVAIAAPETTTKLLTIPTAAKRSSNE